MKSNFEVKTRPVSFWLGSALVLGVAVACSVSETVVHAEKSDSVSQTEKQPSDGDKVLAVVGDEPITEDDVESAVAGDMLRLARERHQVLENGLEQVVADKLIELEAEKRGISPEELLAQEVEAKVSQPTDEQVDAFYESRKAQIRQPKEQVADRISQFLSQQSQQQARQELIDRLKREHGFESYLEPLRLEVASEGFPARGPEDAAVTIVEFSDFQCPYCSRVLPTLEKIQQNYGDKVRLVFRQFPLRSIHPQAQKAAEASLCAHDQEKFWEMHDAMFENQRQLSIDQLKSKAADLGLDTEAFNECLESSRYAEQVQSDLVAGSQAGVTGTPAMFVNGRFLSGAQPYEAIAKVIDEELASSPGS